MFYEGSDWKDYYFCVITLLCLVIYYEPSCWNGSFSAFVCCSSLCEVVSSAILSFITGISVKQIHFVA